MIVNHATGEQTTLRAIRQRFTGIAQTADPAHGIRTPWADENSPTDAELRVIGYSYVEQTPRPEHSSNEQARHGAIEYDDQADAWHQTWIVEQIPVWVPAEVYGHQMRAVLRSTPHGDGTLWTAVLALVDQLPGSQRATVDDSLRTAAVMRRDSPTIAAFQAALSLTPGYVDGLFIAAAEVRV